MKINKLMMASVLTLTVGILPYANAGSIQDTPRANCMQKCSPSHEKRFADKKDAEAFQIAIKSMREHLRPLVKEKHALRMQFIGKMATPGINWNDVLPIIEKLNQKEVEINLIKAKTKFDLFQKTGEVMHSHHRAMPLKAHRL